MRERIPVHWWLSAILLASVVLRVVLVVGGGQFYWPDEGRYDTSHALVRWLVSGDTDRLFDRLNRADHVLFKFIGMIPAALEHWFGENRRIPALFFSAFSTLNIWLVWGVARRLGAAASEALLAAALLAASTTFFYYSRHVLPYDLAISFGLLSLYAGLLRESRPAGSLTAGVLAGCAFLTYAGAWLIGAAVLIIHVARASSWREFLRRSLTAGAGLAAPIAAAGLISMAFGGRLLESFVDFADTIDQGVYSEGWSLPFEYLWHAEHGLLLLWMVCVAAAAWRLRRGDQHPRLHAGFIGLATIYAAIVITSVVLEQFVVYGRLARHLVPFFCLITAAELERLRTTGANAGRRLVPVLAIALLVQTALNFQQPLRQWFPDDFQYAHGHLAAGNAATEYIWTYSRHIYPVPEPLALPPDHTVVASAPHPLQFLPYQYEGYAPAERGALRATDISMRLVAVPGSNP